jgi:hypothetical protein
MVAQAFDLETDTKITTAHAWTTSVQHCILSSGVMNRRMQLEIPLESNAGLCRRHAPRRRMSRARWWFSQMRLAVEQASDWQPELVDRSTEKQVASSASEASKLS